MSLKKIIFGIINYTSNQIYFLKFLIHVNKKFKIKNNRNTNKITLVEFNPHKPAIIGILYLIKCLQKNHNSKIIFFSPGIIFDLKKFLFRTLSLVFFYFKQALIFTVTGAKIKILINLRNKNKDHVEKKFKEVFNNLKTKKDLPFLKLENILVGDLFYDTYTRWNAKPTIDLNSKEFKEHLFKYFQEFYEWLEIFKKKNIESLVVTHPVYNLAIPLRIAQKFGIPVYIGSINFLQYFDKNRKHLWDNNYRDNYSLLSYDKKIEALEFSKKKLEIKFNPNQISENDSQNSVIQRDIHWGRLDTFSPIRRKNFLKKNGKPNVVVLAHCFYDSPHNEGDWLFPDFYEWIDYIFKISKVTDYNWYIKKHPASVEQKLNDETIYKFVKKYPNIEILNDVNNTELLADKVDLILTAWGSAGYEFSYHNIPVILASNSCSYAGYNFTYKPKNLEEFDYAIKNFEKINFSFDKKDIYKFYYNQILTYWDLYPNYQKYINGLNSNLAKDDKIFRNWYKDFSEKEHNKNLNDVNDFVINKKSQLITSIVDK
jgi:hypothetical protein